MPTPIVLRYDGPAPKVNERLIPQRGGQGRMVLAARYRKAKDAMAYEFHRQWSGPPLTGRLTVCIKHVSQLDVDAPVKGVLDALEAAAVIRDDKEVEMIQVLRRLGKRGRFSCEVVVVRMGGDDGPVA